MTAKRVDEAEEFLASYPAAVSELALSLRSIIAKTIPDAKETVDRSGRVIGYVVGAGYAGLACTITGVSDLIVSAKAAAVSRART